MSDLKVGDIVYFYKHSSDRTLYKVKELDGRGHMRLYCHNANGYRGFQDGQDLSNLGWFSCSSYTLLARDNNPKIPNPEIEVAIFKIQCQIDAKKAQIKSDKEKLAALEKAKALLESLDV